MRRVLWPGDDMIPYVYWTVSTNGKVTCMYTWNHQKHVFAIAARVSSFSSHSLTRKYDLVQMKTTPFKACM